MRKELIFNNGHNKYNISKCFFKKIKNPININEVDINKIFLSNKAPYGTQRSYIILDILVVLVLSPCTL